MYKRVSRVMMDRCSKCIFFLLSTLMVMVYFHLAFWSQLLHCILCMCVYSSDYNFEIANEASQRLCINKTAGCMQTVMTMTLLHHCCYPIHTLFLGLEVITPAFYVHLMCMLAIYVHTYLYHQFMLRTVYHVLFL